MRHIQNVRALRQALANGQREFKVHLGVGIGMETVGNGKAATTKAIM
jgi:hypothetical protein